MKTNSPASGFFRENHTARFVALGLLAVLLLGALSRAHGQTAEKAAVDPAGVYTLVSVDGKAVPCTINHEGTTTMDLQSGVFTITTNGHITSVMTVSVGDRRDIRCETHATYTRSGAELSMKWQNAGMTKGRITGNVFTMTNEGMAYIYKK